MKRLFAALLLAPAIAFAGDATMSLNFDKVPLMAFAQSTYKGIFKENYYIDPRLVDDSRRLTLQVEKINTDQIKPLLAKVLSEQGIRVENRNGINWLLPATDTQAIPAQPLPGQLTDMPKAAAVTSAPSEDSDVQVYRPTHRPAAQLQQIANALLSTVSPASDVVTLTGDKQRVARVLKLLAMYDTPPAELFARAAVIEYTQDSESGFSVSTALSALSGKLKLNLAGSTFANFISLSTGSIDAILSAIEGDSRFNLVSQPTIRVRSGATGTFNVGNDVPVLGSVQNDNNGNPIQSVTYRSSGVLLTLKPTILDGRIDLEIQQQLSSFQKNSTSGIDSPTLTKRELTTTIGTKDGETIVLAGLDEAKDSTSESGFSFLPKFLHTTKKNSSKTQLLLVLEVHKL